MKKKLILLFLVAFAIRSVFCLSYNISELYPDVIGYHMYAFNLIDNGHYSPLHSPTEDTFFREPAGPYILKTAYQIASFFDVDISPICNYSMTEYAVLEYHPEFYWGRLMFSLIDSVSICFFFLTLLYFTTQKKAMIVTTIYLLFFPCFFFLQTLLRDSFQVSLLLILNYFFVRYLFKGSRYALLIVGLLLGIAILTLKALAVIGLGIIVFIFCAHRKSFKRFFVDAVLVTVVSCLTITPWMIKVYNSYPSIDVFKELGTSLTFDLGEYCTAIRVLRFSGEVSVDDSEKMLVDIWAMDSKKQFAFSFDNTFKQRADSVYALMGDKKEYYLMRYNFSSYCRAAENLIYPNSIWGILPTSVVFKINTFVSPLFILLGILGLLGFFAYFKAYWKGVMVYTSLMVTLVFLPSFGDEGRRLLLFYSAWIPFSLLLVSKMIFYLRKKWWGI
ncbi:glycosyltransferase family 39 protein [Bacteroides reticulotermitis]|nr:glycosyltransferase family 39 protein [Bacteroides reticulotermitis]MBB4044033.1 hypothetical protein [Bacteroides reticulotermitis]